MLKTAALSRGAVDFYVSAVHGDSLTDTEKPRILLSCPFGGNLGWINFRPMTAIRPMGTFFESKITVPR